MGVHPFQAATQEMTFALIQKGKINFDSDVHISEEAKNLIKGFLTVNPTKRITAAEAIKHAWFKNVEKIEEELYNKNFI